MATSDFGPKLLRGDSTSSEEWQQHLQAVHAQFPSATSAALALRTTQQGQSSYQFLVDSAVAAARTSGRPVDILDLACGDGYLVEECLRQLGARISSVTGVDMSETALDASRARLNAPQVRLCRGLAQSLPLTDASIDVALCHAAFMLMLPLEPVVAGLRACCARAGRSAQSSGRLQHRPRHRTVRSWRRNERSGRRPEPRCERSGTRNTRAWKPMDASAMLER